MNKIGMNPISTQYFSSNQVKKETVPMEAEEKSFDIPQEAAETLKASVLYKPKSINATSEFKEFIPLDASPKEVRDILADKEQVGRSFFGHKAAIRKGIEKSKNPEQAIENLNFLLNAKNKKLPAGTISQVLAITENVNNGSKWSGGYSYYKKHYGFEGGKLTDENLEKILKVKEMDDMMAMMVMASQPIYTAPTPAPYVPMTPIPVPSMPMGSVMI